MMFKLRLLSACAYLSLSINCYSQASLDQLISEMDTLNLSYKEKRQRISVGLNLLQDQDNDSIVAEFYLRAGITYGMKGESDSSLMYFDKSRSFATPQQHLLKSRLSNGVGNVNRTLGNTGMALEAFQSALKEVADKSDQASINHKGSVLGNIAGIYFGVGDMSKAEKSTQIALEHALSIDDFEQIAFNHVRLGLIYQRIGEFEKAQQSHQKASYLIKEYNVRYLYGYNRINFAKLYANNGYHEKSLIIYEELIHEDNIDFEIETSSLVNASEIYLKIKDYEKSIEYSNKLLEISAKHAALPMAVGAYELLYNAYQQSGDYKTANGYMNQYLILNDSLINTESLKVLSELETKYESEQKEQEVTQLKLKNEQASNQRNIYLFVITITLIVTLLLVLLVRTKSKSNRVIAKSLDEKETLLKEIHHRVKNNLQIVSSLLNLQAGHLEDEAAIEAVKEGQNRVKSMALIHQKLYQNDDIRGVEVYDYIENLTHALFGSFGVSQEMIEVELDIDQLRLDIDTLIPLGLILNELLSNALKYAYPNGEGKLSVKLNKNEDMLLLKVRDNGPGFDSEQLESSNSYGWKMIRSLSRKLKADIDIKNESGTVVTLQIKSFKLVA